MVGTPAAALAGEGDGGPCLTAQQRWRAWSSPPALRRGWAATSSCSSWTASRWCGGAVRAALEAGLDRVVVVLGHEADRVREALAGLPCRTVLNPDHALGVRHLAPARGSARCRRKRRPPSCVLADMPLRHRGDDRRAGARYREGGAPLVVSSYGEVDAPPTLYDRALFAELLAIGRRGLREAGRAPAPARGGGPRAGRRPRSRTSTCPRTTSGSRAPAGGPSAEGCARDRSSSTGRRLARRGEPFALATVVARKPPISAQVGDMASGHRATAASTAGSAGAARGRPWSRRRPCRRWRTAGRARHRARPRPRGARRRPGAHRLPHDLPQRRERGDPHPAGPARPAAARLRRVAHARALARLGKAMGYAVHAVDPHADAAGFPDADAVFTEPRAARCRPRTGRPRSSRWWRRRASGTRRRARGRRRARARYLGGGGEPQALRRDARRCCAGQRARRRCWRGSGTRPASTSARERPRRSR